MDAKKTLNDFVKKIDKEFEIYWDSEIKNNFGFNSKQKNLVKKILLHSKEHNLRPAKRLRGSFVYFACKLLPGVDNKIAMTGAMAIELVHTALLMHDDVMDQDNLRRGLPTTHKYFEKGDSHYGESMAYTIGDAVLCMGFELLGKCRGNQKRTFCALQHLLRSIVNTAFGQAYDVTLEKLKDTWTEEDVIALHRAKTAIYTYENPLFVGATLAGVKNKKIYKILHDYSNDGGVAFQLQDDILGVYGDSKKTGKSSDSDLLQGKCTLLVLKVFKTGSPEQIRALSKVWGKRKASIADIKLAKQAIIDSGSLEYSKKSAKKFAQKAVITAEKLRQFTLNKEAIDYIQGIAQYMVEREV
jgi:geranylgeranyl diphosphate synthase, type I